MKYDVYSKSDDCALAIPTGFNFFAFLFHWCWLIALRMYLFALIFILLVFSAILLSEYLEAKAFAYLSFIAWLALGLYGNKLRAWHLRYRGYKKVASIEAPNPEKAVQSVLGNFSAQKPNK
ncbi:DUF2628 domain-containing protein [Arenicella xantha]|uniref:Uncharacterized protein DUF2628 n=1 Tax=Arenicella xantha TaxID=644221 RepID=A0A395JGQ9_9GAMM|nr:DUF2628 domain-containing protein [Arenicella xantha]RBP45614.1 uncharacterized protein DUF2628 [Arenicella xantha]